MPIPVSSKTSSSPAAAAPSGGVADLFSSSASGAPDATFASQFEDAASDAVAAQVAASAPLPLHGIRSGAGDTVAGGDADSAASSDDAASDPAATGAALSSDATFAAALQVLAGFTQSQTAPQPLPPLPTGDAAAQPPASDAATAVTAPADAATTAPAAAPAPLSPDAALPGAGVAATAATAAPLPGADAGTSAPSSATAPATATPQATVGALPLTVQPLPTSLSKPLADARAQNFTQAATAPAKDGKDAKGTGSATSAPTAPTVSTTTAPSSDASAAVPLRADPLLALATVTAAPAPASPAPTAENNAAATVVGGTNAPSLADLGVLSPTSSEAKAAGIGAQDPKKEEKEDSKAVSSASDKDDSGFGTVFSGTTAMGLFSENSARLGTTTDISFGNALKAYRNGGGDIASATASPKGGGETRSRTVPNNGAGADALLPGGVPASVHAQAQSHGAQAASAATTGGDVDEASATRFLDLVKQAVGEPLSSPQRISVELQTPPGETVTVFFSQAGTNGPVRAQLSASDATSLQWLQQQVSSLRDAATGNGATIVWLPPQLDQSQNRQGKDARQDGSRRDSNAKGQSRVRSAEDVALADSLFGANGSLSTLSR